MREKKVLNKCLPQHIKLNIYLHFKGEHKKWPSIVLCAYIFCCFLLFVHDCCFCPFHASLVPFSHTHAYLFWMHWFTYTEGFGALKHPLKRRTEVNSHKIIWSKTNENTEKSKWQTESTVRRVVLRCFFQHSNRWADCYFCCCCCSIFAHHLTTLWTESVLTITLSVSFESSHRHYKLQIIHNISQCSNVRCFNGV